MSQHLKSGFQPPGYGDSIQCVVHQVEYMPASETHEMMVQRHVRIKPRAVVSDIYLMRQPGLPENAERVIHRIPGNHRVLSTNCPKQIVGGRMTRRAGERAIDGRTLRCQPDAAGPEPGADGINSQVHLSYIGIIPRYHTHR